MGTEKIVCLVIFFSFIDINSAYRFNQTSEREENKAAKALSLFNVVKFANIPCTSTNSGYNGTCYTTAECTAKGGSAAGACASSFGVCCVFSLACGATSSENNTYALMTNFNTASDQNPCSYKICKSSADVCKLRIDFNRMVLAPPAVTSATIADTDGLTLGHCLNDDLTVSVPGGQSPPVICGKNTGQHMFVSASEQCNTINIHIDTGVTTTNRTWEIKVTQYECGDTLAPASDCLQYFTSSTGDIASFNWDLSYTTATLPGTINTHVHLVNQYYSICFRRNEGKCSMCYYPYTVAATGTAGQASSYGVGASGTTGTQQSAVGDTCSGVTHAVDYATAANEAGYGDYLEITNMQAVATGATGTATNAPGMDRVCGAFFNAAATAAAHVTVCTYSTPFRVGVHFDAEEAIQIASTAMDLEKTEIDYTATTGQGHGHAGFRLGFFQNSCS